MPKLSRRAYSDMFGPTTGDRIRLADTELIVEVEREIRKVFPVNLKEWAEKKGWHTTIDIKTEVHGYNGKTANIISSGKRIKKDRTLIEEYSAFYAFKKIGSEWKMYAISQVINND